MAKRYTISDLASLFTTALWELGLGFAFDAIVNSLMELFSGISEEDAIAAISSAQQAQLAGAGVMGITPIPWVGPAPIPAVPGITGGWYYDVVCTFAEEDTGEPTDRLIRVQSDVMLTASEIYGKAFDQAVYYQQVTGSDRFQNLDLESKKGQKMIECRVIGAFQGIG